MHYISVKHHIYLRHIENQHQKYDDTFKDGEAGAGISQNHDGKMRPPRTSNNQPSTDIVVDNPDKFVTNHGRDEEIGVEDHERLRSQESDLQMITLFE